MLGNALQHRQHAGPADALLAGQRNLDAMVEQIEQRLGSAPQKMLVAGGGAGVQGLEELGKAAHGGRIMPARGRRCRVHVPAGGTGRRVGGGSEPVKLSLRDGRTLGQVQ